MYFTRIDDEDYAIKPMNCPGSVLVYASKSRSYRDLPLRLASSASSIATRSAAPCTACSA
jgi:threonyl-tRNA synthetase